MTDSPMFRYHEIRSADFCVVEAWREKEVDDGRWTMDGWKREWHENGGLKSMIYYRDGKADGFELLFYPTGLLRYLRCYQDDTPVGETFVFDETGWLARMFSTKGGVRHGFDVCIQGKNYTLSIFAEGTELKSDIITRDRVCEIIAGPFRRVHEMLRVASLPFPLVLHPESIIS